ncbi:PREDICTED: prefoldin subunit 5 [Ceratosolen solmsi marchali]|uniref:Prefoldin subunit 5 n=1 Tax=Ceratosolen solmsi marchali TaxID=326594 RepID=A0AAJ6YH07_9HYME|nr:PREDICTED: prefoldin subunit 5 [Ceratosolen solmsi marchali]XP_011497908.1 PREDICTED: prefoldin subunit 5 [Ceratosolen solmsi marchali]XP_011497909.1 PREDICTED: prefoldin subunit 5 [Ceratosolen solmsi marchali]
MSEISLTEQPNMFQIDLNQLDLQQLTMFKQQLDQSLSVFQDSLQSLKIAQNKFQESNDCLDKFTPDTKGKDILVPLTGSMYVPGKLINTENVLIDIGTGYFAEKTISEAKEYFKRRVSYVTEQIEHIQTIAQEKSKIREITIDIMETKLQNLQKDAAQRA